MAPGIFSRLWGGLSGRGSRQNNEAWRRAQKVGPTSVLGSINPLASDAGAWQRDRDSKRRGVRMRYQSDRKKLIGQRRGAERRFRDELRRRQEKIENYYKRKEGRLGTERSSERARDKFRESEGEMSRKFDRTWREQERALARARDRQYREITKSMHKESREARGLPGQTQLPWN